MKYELNYFTIKTLSLCTFCYALIAKLQYLCNKSILKSAFAQGKGDYHGL